jgi:hypothetical protein
MNGRRAFGSWFNQIHQSWTFNLDQVRLPYASEAISRGACASDGCARSDPVTQSAWEATWPIS